MRAIETKDVSFPSWGLGSSGRQMKSAGQFIEVIAGDCMTQRPPFKLWDNGGSSEGPRLRIHQREISVWLKGKQTAEDRFSMCTLKNPCVLPYRVLKIVVDGETKDRPLKTYATL